MRHDVVRRVSLWSAVLLAAALVVGCAPSRHVRPAGVQTKALAGYLDGLEELESGNYKEAIRHFQAVASSPRYFRYTALAALRLADALFYQEMYARAIEAYHGFIKQYAGNPNIPYAEFRVAQCHFERIPGDWFLLPAAYEKELSTTRGAYEALTRFLNHHPRHRFVPVARRMRAFCVQRLVEHELYVADFYEGRGRPRGVVQRLESALRSFPARATTEDNLLWLARAYSEADDPAGQASAIERYLAAFPDGERSGEARSQLEVLEKTIEHVPDPSGTPSAAPAGDGAEGQPDEPSE